MELLQSGQRLRVVGERLPGLAGRLERVRLLHEVVDGDVLVVGTLLGARHWQRDEKNQTHECGKTFHAGKIAEWDTAWQRLLWRTCAGVCAGEPQAYGKRTTR